MKAKDRIQPFQEKTTYLFKAFDEKLQCSEFFVSYMSQVPLDMEKIKLLFELN